MDEIHFTPDESFFIYALIIFRFCFMVNATYHRLLFQIVDANMALGGMEKIWFVRMKRHRLDNAFALAKRVLGFTFGHLQFA